MQIFSSSLPVRECRLQKAISHNTFALRHDVDFTCADFLTSPFVLRRGPAPPRPRPRPRSTPPAAGEDVAPQVRVPAPRLAGLPAAQAHAQAPRPPARLPAGRPGGRGAPDGLHRLQGGHDARAARRRPPRLQDPQEGGGRGRDDHRVPARHGRRRRRLRADHHGPAHDQDGLRGAPERPVQAPPLQELVQDAAQGLLAVPQGLRGQGLLQGLRGRPRGDRQEVPGPLRRGRRGGTLRAHAARAQDARASSLAREAREARSRVARTLIAERGCPSDLPLPPPRSPAFSPWRRSCASSCTRT